MLETSARQYTQYNRGRSVPVTGTKCGIPTRVPQHAPGSLIEWEVTATMLYLPIETMLHFQFLEKISGQRKVV